MYQEDYIDSLRTELLNLVESHLTPVAMRYGYSEVPLETNIKWRPQVLVLGNYSSGKSTLINDFLGADIQATGQAPTDDSFTIITYDHTVPSNDSIHVTEERDGKFLLNDPEYPFESLKKHGQRFISHFRLKKVNSPFLKNLAIIDTPGMLDSITERDRGYNYQEVIGDFAQIADLVLILFDPHKAGTVREAHTSLRDTLPSRTFEDRVLFVLNRVDECASLIDLLQVYGTLCWNLSQMTGRKDIPTIHLTYSTKAAASSLNDSHNKSGYLHYLGNQRNELKRAIQEAPRYRLDHLATFVETHAERLSHLLETLRSYRRRYRKYRLKFALSGLLACAVATGAGLFALLFSGIIGGMDPVMTASIGSAVTLGFWVLWLTVPTNNYSKKYRGQALKDIDNLTPLENQTRRDSWSSIREVARAYLEKNGPQLSIGRLTTEYDAIKLVYDTGCREIREALNELISIGKNDTATVDSDESR